MPPIAELRSREGIAAGSATSLEARWLQRGLRLTEHRRIVMEVLEASPDHPSAREIYRRAATGRRIGVATVYRTLNALVEAGIMKCQVFPDGRTHYERVQPGAVS